MEYDVFISHASEDKEAFVEPLIAELEGLGLRVWYDRDQIRLGDDFRVKMDEGLRRSRFGVVVLSPSFSKYWPETELSALFQQESAFDQKRILPVFHGLSPKEVVTQWPLLSARAAVPSSEGPAEVARRIAAAVRDSPGPRPRGASPLYGVPDTRSVEFVGRGVQMAQIEEILRQGGSVRIAASIEGLPGIGKTELALQLVHHLAGGNTFPGGIFWFNAENPDLVPTWGGPIADALRISGGPVEERAREALHRVSRSAAPTLVVLDNVETWSAEQRPGPLPDGTHLRYLVTTRQRRLGGKQFQHVEVGVLDPKSAKRLLDSASERALAEAPGYEDLLSYLGGHALAVELAGAFLAEYPAETPASYLERLQAHAEVEEEVSDLVRYSRTVTQAFDTLRVRLDEEVLEAWRLAACFEPELVSPELTESVGLGRKALGHLRRLHLLEVDGGGRWWMHRLTREYGRRAGSEAELEAAQRAFVLGCAKFADRIELGDGFRPYLANQVHLDSAVQLAPDVLESGDSRVSEFQNQIATGLQSAGDLIRARALFEHALESDFKNLGDDHPEVATKRSNLALVLQDLGDLPAARDLLEQALESDLKNRGEDHPDVARDRSNLAMVLKDLGDLPAARDLLEKALASALQNLGEDHPTVAIRRSNLAGVLQDLGDLPTARDLLEQALESDLKNRGKDHPYVAIDHSNLATVLRELGDLPAARDLLEQALASDLKNLGEDHPYVAIDRSILATVLRDLGDLEGARVLAIQALKGAALQPEGSLVRKDVEAAMRRIVGDDFGSDE